MIRSLFNIRGAFVKSILRRGELYERTVRSKKAPCVHSARGLFGSPAVLNRRAN